MLSVGVRELKEQTSEILQRVRENGEVVEITYRGRACARLVPVRPRPLSPAEIEAIMADLDKIAAEIGKKWPAGVSAVDAVRDVRRDL